MAQQIENADQLPTIVYDAQGNPIDTSALRSSSPTDQPQVVYMARPHDPVKPVISDAVIKKHEESKALFPFLNLSDGEYVISYVKRHIIGLIEIWAVVVAVVVMMALAIFAVQSGSLSIASAESTPWLLLTMLGVIALAFVLGMAATVIYEGNKFFLTNESVTQHIQTSLFSKKEQTISLGNIEDASFRKSGIMQTFFNYGSLRLSTEGDETTYRFNFVSSPGDQVATLNNAVEAFKNGRPIDPYET